MLRFRCHRRLNLPNPLDMIFINSVQLEICNEEETMLELAPKVEDRQDTSNRLKLDWVQSMVKGLCLITTQMSLKWVQIEVNVQANFTTAQVIRWTWPRSLQSLRVNWFLISPRSTIYHLIQIPSNYFSVQWCQCCKGNDCTIDGRRRIQSVITINIQLCWKNMLNNRVFDRHTLGKFPLAVKKIKQITVKLVPEKRPPHWACFFSFFHKI